MKNFAFFSFSIPPPLSLSVFVRSFVHCDCGFVFVWFVYSVDFHLKASAYVFFFALLLLLLLVCMCLCVCVFPFILLLSKTFDGIFLHRSSFLNIQQCTQTYSVLSPARSFQTVHEFSAQKFGTLSLHRIGIEVAISAFMSQTKLFFK